MPDDITVIFDDAAVKAWAGSSPGLQMALARLTAQITVVMKAATPVSPVYPAIPRGGGSLRPGDRPLRPSGYLRSSIHAFREPNGDVLIGPTADYAQYVNNDTRPHIIRSHGNWPLRSRATGQVFGPVVHHPGTRGHHFIEKAAASIDGERVHV